MWPMWMAMALAQTPPVPRGVAALAETSPCEDVTPGWVPRIIQTNVGVLTYGNDGTYGYACPARFGGELGAEVVSTPDGREILVGGIEGAWFSSNSGCAATRVDVPDTGIVIDVMYWRQAFWLLHRDVSVGQSALYRFDGTNVSAIVTWNDFNPDGMVPEGNDFLWVAGASPLGVRRLGFLGGLSGNEPLDDLPVDVQQVRSVVPVAARDGEAWIKLERQTSEWAWHAEIFEDAVGGTEVVFTDASLRPRTMLGPVWSDNAWISVQDLDIHWTRKGDPTWRVTPHEVRWTCLETLGDRTFACVFDGIEAVLGFDDDVLPLTNRVFDLSQVAGVEEACASTADCDAEWLTLWADTPNIDAEEPAICPDGTRASDGERGECACDAGSVGWAWTPLMLWGLLRRHRRETGSAKQVSSTRPSQS